MSRTPKIAVELRTYHERTRELERLKQEKLIETPPTIKENEGIQNFTTPNKTTVNTSSRFSLVQTGSLRNKIQEWNSKIERRSSLSSEVSPASSSPVPETPPPFRRASSYRSLTRDIADIIPKRNDKKDEWWKGKTTPTLSRTMNSANVYRKSKQENRISQIVQDFEFSTPPSAAAATTSACSSSLSAEIVSLEKEKLIDSLPESSVDRNEDVSGVVLRRNKNIKGKKYSYRKSDGNFYFLQSLGPKPYNPNRRSLDGSIPTLV